MTKLAINGFGRIGRMLMRAALLSYRQEVEVVAVNTSGSMDISGWANLLKYDTVYGRFPKEIKVKPSKNNGEIGALTIEGKNYPFLAIREPEKIPWRKYEVEVVAESTGVFRTRQTASKHFLGGAEKVILSAPPKSEGIPLFLLGVNEKKYRGEKLISNGSCTTNCAAPLAKIILENFGVEKAAMVTIHAYTASQRLVDGSHKDLRRGRAAALNIVPTTTGAASAVVAAIPELSGKFCATALRVPVVCGSFSDFTFLTSKKVSKGEVNKLLSQKAQEEFQGIVKVSEEPLVSSDIIGDSASCLVDLSGTEVIGGNLLRLSAWYDNEWAYACRLLELASYITLAAK